MTGIHASSMVIKLAVFWTMLACNKDPSSQEAEIPGIIVTPPAATDTGLKRYLALGDSYTIGESVPVSDRYPVIAAGGKSNHVVVLSIPDYGVKPFGQRGEPEKVV